MKRSRRSFEMRYHPVMRGRTERAGRTATASPRSRGPAFSAGQYSRWDASTDGADTFMDDVSLFDRMASELYAAVISDILDQLGFRHQVMAAQIRPIDPAFQGAVVGRAATVRYAPQYEVPPEPYTTIIAAIDALQPGDVPVLATGGM
ncbi:MAG: hypothetical protein C4346_18795, partial [Chloroflexota bacterium]